MNQVNDLPGARVAIGVLASRQRAAALLDCPPEELGKRLWQSVDHPIPPVLKEGPALCQQVVHRADAPDFDLRTLVPAPTNTPAAAGPYITMGMCYATHPDTGEKMSPSTASASRGGTSCPSTQRKAPLRPLPIPGT